MLNVLTWQSIQQRVNYQIGIHMFKIQNSLMPEYLKSVIIPKKSTYCTRYNVHSTLFIRTPRTDYYKRSLHYYGSIMWNKLTPTVKTTTSLYSIKKQLKSLSLVNAL